MGRAARDVGGILGTTGGGHPGCGLLVGDVSGVWNPITLGHIESVEQLVAIDGGTCDFSVASSKLPGCCSILIVSSFFTTKTELIVVVVVIVDDFDVAHLLVLVA